MSTFDVDALIAALTGEGYTPRWEGSIEGYTVNFVQDNFWRVQRTMGRDDVMQEAYCVFLRLKRRYKVREPAHFMALYKTSWQRTFDDLAWIDTHDRVTVRDVSEEDGQAIAHIGELENDGYLATMIRQAPQEVLMVLNLMLRAPQELVIEILGAWTGNPDARSTSNGSKRINELLGLPLDQDSLGAVKAYFSP